jgi:hypothetical protein
VVAERRRAAHKARHKEKEIAKRDRNDDRIKRRKTMEANVSSNEDPSPSPPWSGDKLSVDVDWSGMSGSPLSSLRGAAEVSSTWQSELVARERGAGLGS